ncbi:hypothetical protein WY02_20540 [Pseudonocardia sp. AL041005-10]|nr:HigA family addiction module antitoxin [Pseudonocardia sp. AL041005-10]ALE80402.1 hypothetical protein WY02_20540 [Pseudonocardia sp. AL041005-10]
MSSQVVQDESPRFEPDYALAPGETLADWLDENEMTQRELAVRLGVSPKHLNQLVKGSVPLTSEVAWRLERVTGISADMWLRIEADFRATTERLQKRESLLSVGSWIKTMPVSALVSRGYLPAGRFSDGDRAEQLLSFFGVASPDSWADLWHKRRAAFRQTKAFDIDEQAVAAWLRIGELTANSQWCAPFNAKKLWAALPQLRALTTEPMAVFFSEARKICASSGVALVVVEEIRGCRISGATHWPSKSRAVLQLSLRDRKDDRVLFTFFHEVGHILLDGPQEFRIEDGSEEDESERRANEFAAEALIPAKYETRLLSLKSLTSIQAFAAEIAIPPGVVVGRLQRDKVIGWNVGNGLKRTVTLQDAQ